MEADWEFEVAPDAPVIDGAWGELVDLRTEPERAPSLPEAEQLPGLAQALVRLNGSQSPVWTAKCDIWTPDEFDVDELDAPREAACQALACYIDLLPKTKDMWSTIDSAADWCRQFCMTLRAIPLRQCRTDMVVRPAFLAADRTGLGVTAYVMGCGANAIDARRMLAAALLVLVDAVCQPTPSA